MEECKLTGGECKPIAGKIVTKPFLFFLAVALIAGIFLIKRFIFGIGSVSHLNDGYPWGVWIVYDVMIGTAIGCGGYSMALLVYVFNKGAYHPLVRSALMAGMFGYTLAAVSVFFDIGRYWQMYNIFLPWYVNLNSVMLEVALCIAAYVGVMWVEFSPAFLEKLNSPAKSTVNKIMFIFIALGVLLPTMHQSSLGSLMIIAGRKVDPLWQTGFLPLLFLISAITMGFAVVIFESIMSTVGFRRPPETHLLSKLSVVIRNLLIGWLIIRFGDLIWRGQLGHMFGANLQSIMFDIEIILFVVPVVILSSAANRAKQSKLFVAASSMLVAGSVYRFNAALVGFNPGPGFHYFPSFQELWITLGIISVEIMVYLIFVKRLPVLPDMSHGHTAAANRKA